MIGQVEDARFVGGGSVIDLQLVSGCQRIRNGDRESAGVTFLAVITDVAQLNRGRAFSRCVFGPPDAFIEPLGASVQRILAVILLQAILAAIERKPAIGDAVAVTADERAEIRFGAEI